MERSVAFSVLLEVSPTFCKLDTREAVSHVTALVDLYHEYKVTHSMWDLARTYAAQQWGE